MVIEGKIKEIKQLATNIDRKHQLKKSFNRSNSKSNVNLKYVVKGIDKLHDL